MMGKQSVIVREGRDASSFYYYCNNYCATVRDAEARYHRETSSWYYYYRQCATVDDVV